MKDSNLQGHLANLTNLGCYITAGDNMVLTQKHRLGSQAYEYFHTVCSHLTEKHFLKAYLYTIKGETAKDNQTWLIPELYLTKDIQSQHPTGQLVNISVQSRQVHNPVNATMCIDVLIIRTKPADKEISFD